MKLNGHGLRVHQWMHWLTDERLSRLNHLRHRAMAEPLDREQAARLLASLKPEALDEVKARIAG